VERATLPSKRASHTLGDDDEVSAPALLALEVRAWDVCVCMKYTVLLVKRWKSAVYRAAVLFRVGFQAPGLGLTLTLTLRLG